MSWNRGKFGIILACFQIVFIILFAIFIDYGEQADAKGHEESELENYYPLFQDVHVMIFIGFGFLMTFLKRYGFGSIGFNFLLAAFVIQWATLMEGFFWQEDGTFHVGAEQMLTADFAAAAVLISFGAVLGKVSPLQLIIMAFLEIIILTVNLYLGLEHLKVLDVGGSMFIHTFGAYFGLTVARILYKKSAEDNDKEGSVYHSDLFSMIGTIFLWLFWPSFNAALAQGDDRYRAVLNTYYSLAACTVTTFVISHLVQKDGKFNMVHIQNATLAGGVAVGSSADLMIHPWGALIIGTLAGILSTIGYTYFTPCLSSKAKVHDTCGVNNLHGMPGVLAGIIAAIVVSFADEDTYGDSLYSQFPALVPANNTAEFTELASRIEGLEPGDGRSASTQAGYQMVALIVTLAFAIVGGAITGFILKLPIWDPSQEDELFEDEPYWEDIEKEPMMKYADKEQNQSESKI
ncbi:ammonium transporter Rh type B-B-like isoform X2 [Antedon mediterranea]